jgi:hypothetical protein
MAKAPAWPEKQKSRDASAAHAKRQSRDHHRIRAGRVRRRRGRNVSKAIMAFLWVRAPLLSTARAWKICRSKSNQRLEKN